jgi:hypothetical protein
VKVVIPPTHHHERNTMTNYSIAIKRIDDSLEVTRRNLSCDDAERIVEYYHMTTQPGDDWAGLAVIDQNTNEIYSEMEW